MSDPGILSKEERNFLATLLDGNAAAVPAERSFMIDGGEIGNALLTRLATHSKMSMESHFPDCWMSFPVSLAEDEFHALRLTFGAPRIYEYGPNKRPWRLHLGSPLPLLDALGRKVGMRVHELSPNGMLVDVAQHGHAPAQFNLWLALPGADFARDLIEIHGSLVRAKGSSLAAYRLRLGAPEQAEKIRRFIFLQHRLQHPELELDIPA